MSLQIVRRSVLVFLSLMFVILPVSAQDNLPWPPDPDTLFAPGIEILSVEETESATEAIHCGWSSHSNSGWVYTIDGDQLQLCNVATGENRNLPPLTPDDVGYLPNEFNRAVLSPDETWLVYAHDVKIPRTNGQRVVSSYRISDGHINLLGTIDLPVGLNHPEVKGFADWLSDRRGTLMLDILGDSVGDDYYAFDVTQPDSLEPVAEGFYEHFEGPGRFEVITTGYVAFRTTMQGHFDCIFSLYDDQGTYELNLGYDCIGARVLYGGDHYFTLQLEDEDSTTSNLLRFDPQTDERNVLLNGELEWLVGVSPEGRYALLMMDDNGQLDLAHEDFGMLYSFASYGDLLSDETSRIALWDNDRNEIIHEITVTPEPDVILPRFQHLWCGDDCLVYAYGCEDDYTVLPVTLLRFDENQGVTSQYLEAGCYDAGLEELIQFSPDTRHIFHRLAPELFIEVEKGISYPLFAEAYRDGYVVHESEWLDDETLKIWLRPNDTRQYGEMAYTLRVAAVFDAANEP